MRVVRMHGPCIAALRYATAHGRQSGVRKNDVVDLRPLWSDETMEKRHLGDLNPCGQSSMATTLSWRSPPAQAPAQSQGELFGATAQCDISSLLQPARACAASALYPHGANDISSALGARWVWTSIRICLGRSGRDVESTNSNTSSHPVTWNQTGAI